VGPTTRTTAALLAFITALAGVLRFYNLAWGAPYYHFHIDEHLVFVGADLLRQDPAAAAANPKFFIYSPLPMYLVALVREVYERVVRPLDLTFPRDEVTYMLLGRSISAAFGTATIPLVFAVASRVAGRVAGLCAAALMAVAVLHVRDSHFFSVDATLVFFCVLCWLSMMKIAAGRDGAREDEGRIRWFGGPYIGAGVSLALALLSKYTAVFLIPAVGVAHLCAPGRPAWRSPARAWMRWAAQGMLPIALAVLLFAALDPLAWLYPDKFLLDVRSQITGPLTGGIRYIWNAHFTGVHPQRYWFTTLLPWAVGPAFLGWSLAGVAWLLYRRDRLALAAAAYPLANFAVAGQTVTPFARYALPLLPALAVAAGVLSADLWRRERWRRVAQMATALVIATSALWAAAYMNVFRQPDARLEASKFLMSNVPRGSAILVEPSHNTPPMGAYYTAPNFYVDYVLWGDQAERDDYYHLYSLDTYKELYSPEMSQAEKRQYIQERLARVDYVVIDDTFMQFYAPLPAVDHLAVKQFYKDLLEGRLGFDLMKTFKVYPSLFGYEINDDSAELSFRIFDHPRIYIFRRSRR
jgi:4-amino-4-deoxy-L-arabinose transferase-like glycosyltransferase